MAPLVGAYLQGGFGMRLKIPKDLKPIQKLNGDVLTIDDIRSLYVADKCNIENIGNIFDVDPVDVYLNMMKMRLHLRIEDYKWQKLAYERQKKNNKQHEKRHVIKRKRLQAEEDKLIWREALEIYGKPRPTQTYIVNGNEHIDKGIQKAYFRDVRDIFLRLKTKPAKFKKLNQVRNVDLSAMRLHRGLDMFAFSNVSQVSYKAIVYYEKTANVIVPKELSDIYFRVLKISKVEFKRILEVLAGNRKTMFQEDSRNIPDSVREYVWHRDGGKCRSCEETKYLHIHHITKFADGGKHEAKNLKLLCVSCHAEVHRNDKAYYMLKKIAEKLLGEVVSA